VTSHIIIAPSSVTNCHTFLYPSRGAWRRLLYERRLRC